uniref:Crp/Fnr family transcriptional regulator n=1 Tax=Prevotella sp. GTC17260 TaxID=3236796 RepID=A0AB33J8U1_9BACT
MQENDIHLYHKLVTLPLFQGLSRSELETIVGETKFGFHQYESGQPIVVASSPCTHLYFLLTGSLHITTQADDYSYQITEYATAPDILQPEHLFGLAQRFSKTFTADTKCYVMTLDKNEIMKLSTEYTIFRMSLLNIISTRSQRLQHAPLRHVPENLKERIARFITDRCLRPAGPKIVKIKMQQLAEELNDSRLDISRALNEMQNLGQLTLKRGYIIIPALERLGKPIT